MTVKQTERTMRAYMDALLGDGDFAVHFADDVEWMTMESGEVVRGRDGVEGLIRGFHYEMFDAQVELGNLICGDGVAAIEAVFTGRHIGEFAGMPATGVDVRLPYTIFYDVDGDRITKFRAYVAISSLVAQVQAGAAASASSPRR